MNYIEPNRFEAENGESFKELKTQTENQIKKNKEYITDKLGAAQKNIPEAEKINDKKENLDLSWVKIGSEVYHKKFGLGIVFEYKKGLIYIKFSFGEKSFQFPQAFENGFLFKSGE